MRKLFLTAAVAVMAAAGAGAQEKLRTEAGHSVSTDLLGVHYDYEHPLGRTVTIVGRAGAKFFAVFGASSKHDNYGVYWGVTPSVEVEPRWYYGLDRRAAKGRGTAGNQGGFLALRLYTYLPCGYVSDRDMHLDGVAFAAPTWGFRRVWSERWLFEFHTGFRLGYGYHGDFDGRRFFPGIDLNARFGYSF